MSNFIDNNTYDNYNIIIEIPRFEWDENKEAEQYKRFLRK